MLKWFLDKQAIVVKKELFDDKSAFLLGGQASDISDLTPKAEFPFLTEVTVDKNDPVYPFGEDLTIYPYDPQYVGGDKPTTVRFRGLTTGWVYTFLGVDVAGPIHEPLDTRSAGENAVYTFFPEPNEASKIGKCVDTTLGVIIYDKDYNIINPLTVFSSDPLIFTKPEGPAANSVEIQRDNSNKGFVKLSTVQYFLAVKSIPLFGGISFPAPKSVVTQTEAAASPNPQTQQRVNSNDTSSTQQTANVKEDTGRPTPQDRIEKRHD